MKAYKKLIFLVFLVSFGCNMPSNSSVPFLWNDEPSPESYQVMVVSELDEDELRSEIEKKLDQLGFVIEYSEDDILFTEPHDMDDNLMRMSLGIEDNMVIITAFEGTRKSDGTINWEIVKRGEEDYGSAEWELLYVLANSINHNSILFN